ANWSNGTIFDELAGLTVAQSGVRIEIPRELTALAEAQRFLGNDHFDEVYQAGLEALLDGLETKFAAEKKSKPR
ncbi:MAG: hypothetical protein GQE15_08095, partial [Archangiaceae bacterium]|nr:hypothetical protein [Archangiaceae bacterium]